MKKSLSSVIWGILFIVLGVSFTMRAFGFNLHIFFDGWWTMFIIIPSLIGVCQKHDRTPSLIGLVIGILLFLSARDWIGWGDFGKFAIAAVFIIIGVGMVFKRNYRVEDFEEKCVRGSASNQNYSVLFGGRTVRFEEEEFTGANLSAAFGSICLDLTNAIINKDVVIEATCALAGIDIRVPENVKVIDNCTPILGGIDNQTRTPVSDGRPVASIYINATCILGGIDIK